MQVGAGTITPPNSASEILTVSYFPSAHLSWVDISNGAETEQAVAVLRVRFGSTMTAVDAADIAPAVSGATISSIVFVDDKTYVLRASLSVQR